jgi:hypothetical protein
MATIRQLWFAGMASLLLPLVAMLSGFQFEHIKAFVVA